MLLAGDAFSWNRNPINFQATESESIKETGIGNDLFFDWNLIMAWNRNQFQVFALESESISFFVSESESNYPLGESILSPMLCSSSASYITIACPSTTCWNG